MTSALEPYTLSSLLALAPPPSWAERVNTAVASRFDGLLGELALTPNQLCDGRGKVAGIVGCLNWHYYDRQSDSDNALVVGSWGKGTQSRPPRDVDVMFVLPVSAYFRFERRPGNRQSQLLQEVKDVLSVTYPNTQLRGDGQVVVVGFANGHGVEVVPAFALENGQFQTCDTNDGGSYKVSDPRAEQSWINVLDVQTTGNTRNLIRLIKCWQRTCNVPLASFEIELLVTDFLFSYVHRATSTALYDWMVRDFFQYLVGRAGSLEIMPGTHQMVWLGDDWLSRARSAHERATKASWFEEMELPFSALDEWQKIFGTDIQ